MTGATTARRTMPTWWPPSGKWLARRLMAKGQQPLSPGIEAPDFTLKVTPDQSITLSDFRGQPVVLIFYPADFSPVCGDELALFNELLPEFKPYNAKLFGI